MSTDVIVALITFSGVLVGGIGSIIGILLSNNKKIEDRFDKIDDKFAEVDGKLSSQEIALKRKDAMDARRRIINFYDEERHSKTKPAHSKEHWDDVLDDVDSYKNSIKWFEEHNIDFQNHKGVHAMEYLESTYEVLEETENFLK